MSNQTPLQTPQAQKTIALTANASMTRAPVVVTSQASVETYLPDLLAKEARRSAIQRIKNYLPSPAQLHMVQQYLSSADRKKKLLEVNSINIMKSFIH